MAIFRKIFQTARARYFLWASGHNSQRGAHSWLGDTSRLEPLGGSWRFLRGSSLGLGSARASSPGCMSQAGWSPGLDSARAGS